MAGKIRRTVSLIALLSAVSLPAFAYAQAVDDPERLPAAMSYPQEIIVTAQKRSESLQETALAITAFSSEDLQRRNITALEDLAQETPGVNITQQNGAARITIRGIGIDGFSTGQESAATLNVDGVVYSRHAAGLAGLYDLERIEVLRGPQGTLYGRNSTSGAINLITRRPTDSLDGFMSLTVGNYNMVNTEAAIGGPIADGVSARVALQKQYRKGYGRNIVTGTDIDDRDAYGFRGQLLFEPSEDLSILLEADYHRGDDNSSGLHVIGPAGEAAPGVPLPIRGLSLPGGMIASDPRDIVSEVDPRLRTEFYGGHATINWTASDTVSIRSISAVRKSSTNQLYDLAPVAPLTLIRISKQERSTQLSQELQVNVATDRHDFVAGVFYLRERLFGRLNAIFNARLFGGPDLLLQGIQNPGRLTTNAAAVYAQDTFSIVPQLRLTVGARYSWEKKAIRNQASTNVSDPFDPDRPVVTPVRMDDETWKSFTPKIGMEYDIAPRVMFYASYTKGFKSGNYNMSNLSPPVEPEEVDAFEAGIKSQTADRRLTANIDAFYYDYTNLQVIKTVDTQLVQENAATARIYGIDGEFTLQPFPSRPLRMSLSGEWLHARFTRYFSSDPARPGQGDVIDPETGGLAFDLSGYRLAQAPDYKISLSVQDTFDIGGGELTPRFESIWTGAVYFTQFNTEALRQPAYNMLNAYISYESEGGDIYLNGFVKNISNKTILGSGSAATALLGAPAIVYLAPPRTYGVTLGYRF